jgi:hypothetical protein
MSSMMFSAAQLPLAFTESGGLATFFASGQIDTAIDRAARISRAVVAAFAAAPAECWDERHADTLAVEFVLEFFVPPPSLELFHRELEAQLLLCSPRYVTGRYRGAFAPCTLHAIPAGTFHQQRFAAGIAAEEQREARWASDRAVLVQPLLHQARTGWREAAVQ